MWPNLQIFWNCPPKNIPDQQKRVTFRKSQSLHPSIECQLIINLNSSHPTSTVWRPGLQYSIECQNCRSLLLTETGLILLALESDQECSNMECHFCRSLSLPQGRPILLALENNQECSNMECHYCRRLLLTETRPTLLALEKD